MKRRSVAVVEPQMEHVFHAPFNAALLHAVRLAFPEVEVSFLAFASHAAVVRGLLEVHAPGAAKSITWRENPGVPAGSTLGRWRQNSRTFRQVLDRGERVVFSSISRMQLLQLKRMMKDDGDVLAVLHGDLERIGEPEVDRFPASLFKLQDVLLRRQPRGLRFVLLGESIRRHMPPEYDAVLSNAVLIDHPYHFPECSHGAGEPLVFGIFGNSGTGTLVEEVARRVKAVRPEVRFRLVGFVADAEAAERLAPYVEGAECVPISREEFVRRAESVTHALWVSSPDSFKLRASGTFFDALAFCKPLVYTANAYVDAYLTGAPEVGVRCAGVEEAAAKILELAAHPDAGGYARSVRAIEVLRKRFAPEALALHLREVFGSRGEDEGRESSRDASGAGVMRHG